MHFDAGDRFQIDVEGVLSKNITVTESASSTAANIEKNLQEMPIFGDTGVTVTGGQIMLTLQLQLAVSLLNLLNYGLGLQHQK